MHGAQAFPTEGSVVVDDEGKIAETIMEKRKLKIAAYLARTNDPATTARTAAGKATAKSKSKAKAKATVKAKAKSKAKAKAKSNARISLKTKLLPNQRQLRGLDNAWRQATRRGIDRFAIGTRVTSRPF